LKQAMLSIGTGLSPELAATETALIRRDKGTTSVARIAASLRCSRATGNSPFNTLDRGRLGTGRQSTRKPGRDLQGRASRQRRRFAPFTSRGDFPALDSKSLTSTVSRAVPESSIRRQCSDKIKLDVKLNGTIHSAVLRRKGGLR